MTTPTTRQLLVVQTDQQAQILARLDAMQAQIDALAPLLAAPPTTLQFDPVQPPPAEEN